MRVSRNGIALVSVLFMLVGLLALTATLFLSLFLDAQAASNVSAGDDALSRGRGRDPAPVVAARAGEPISRASSPGRPEPLRSDRPSAFPSRREPIAFASTRLASGSLRASSEGTSHRGARRKVEAVFIREPRFRPPAAVTIAATTSPTDISGALNVSADETGGELPAYGAESREAAAAFRRARGDATEVAIVGSSGLPDAIDHLREIADVAPDGTQEGGTFGSTGEPVVVRFTGQAEISGTVVVSGIVLADAPLRVRGRLEVDGLLLAPQGIDVEGNW